MTAEFHKLFDKVIKDDLEETSEKMEDMFQAEINMNGELYILDIGWYELENGSSFIVYLVKGNDWDKPIRREIVKSFKEIECIAFEVINKIKNKQT